VPTYQYRCTACTERLEVFQRFTDEPLTECPVCGGTLRKVFSPVGVVFKGSGFYKTDARGSSRSSSSSGEKPSEKPADKPGAPADKPATPSTPSSAPSSTDKGTAAAG
jgi:putative FmdB family regulatory protein